MTVLQGLNRPGIWLVAAVVIVFIGAFCAFLAVRAWKAGIKIGMDKAKLRKVAISSLTFSVLPAISILLGVIALSGTLGTPLPWLRLSVIGALHYETTVADVASRAVGLSGLVASEMTYKAFTTIGLTMTVGIIWGPILNVFFTKGYLNRLQNPKPKKNSEGKSVLAGFADHAMNGMFIGLICAYIGSYMGKLVILKNALPMITVIAAAIAMGVFTYFAEKKQKQWIDNFSVAGSMIVGMAVACAAGAWL